MHRDGHTERRKALGFVLKGIALAGILFFVTTGISILWAVTLDIPTFDSFQAREIAESTKIYDRTEKVVLYDIHGNVKRTIVPISEIAENAQRLPLPLRMQNSLSTAVLTPRASLGHF